nr:MAG TPA: hypothetical protein [Caudoviricetes sp.]
MFQLTTPYNVTWLLPFFSTIHNTLITFQLTMP